MFGVSQSREASAFTVLSGLARNDAEPKVRSEAVFWLAQKSDPRAAAVILDALDKDSVGRGAQEGGLRPESAQGQRRRRGAHQRSRRAARMPAVRSEAIFWLGQKAGKAAAAAITDRIDNDPNTEVKKRAVFALSQMPAAEGVPLLINAARTNPNPEVRKQAMFWLGQSKDPKALAFFEEVLLKKMTRDLGTRRLGMGAAQPAFARRTPYAGAGIRSEPIFRRVQPPKAARPAYSARGVSFAAALLLPSPGRSAGRWPSSPSRIVNRPGNRASHGSLAAGTNWRALASMPALPGHARGDAGRVDQRRARARQVLHAQEHPELLRRGGHQHRLALSLARLQRDPGVAHLARQQQRVEIGERFVDDHRPQPRRLVHHVAAVAASDRAPSAARCSESARTRPASFPGSAAGTRAGTRRSGTLR